MKKQLTILLAFFICFQWAEAQTVTSYAYRTVKQSDMAEYLKRETTYWQKLAESEVKKGNLTFWAVLVKMGGTNLGKSPNVLLINTFNDIDSSNDIWGGVGELFPDVKMEDIQTNTLSKTNAMIYVRDLDNWVQGEDVNPEEDFNFAHIIFHDLKDVGKHLTFESEKWKPMIKKAMDEGTTSVKGWGNSIVISPESRIFPYKTVSYDLFKTAHEALSPAFTDDHETPDNFFEGLDDNYAGPRNSNLYYIVTTVSAEPEEE